MHDRNPKLAPSFVFLLALATTARSQVALCPPGGAVTGYRSEAIAAVFSTILGSPSTVNVSGPGVNDAVALVAFPASFSFIYYGTPRSLLTVCSNGWISFAPPLTATGVNRHPGDLAEPNDAVFPWHDDLLLDDPGSSVDLRFDLTPGAETATIQWTAVSNVLDAGPPATGLGSFSFQCVLYASTHALLPDRIEFLYDRSTSPPVMGPCQSSNPSTYATSATVGCEGSLPTHEPAEPTDRGGGNDRFPAADLRFSPAAFTAGGAGATILLEPGVFLHRDRAPTTVFLPGNCTATCYDDNNSQHALGEGIPLPWKFTLFGRAMKTANMNSNGYLSFGDGAPEAGPSNTLLPDPVDPDAVIAPWWDNLEGDGASQMMFRVLGPAGCRVVAFEWHEFHTFLDPGRDCATGAGQIAFQAKLYEGGAGELASSSPGGPFDVVLPGEGMDRFEFVYDEDTFQSGPFSASVGAENAVGTVGVSPFPGNAVSTPLPGMKVVIDPCDSGVVRYYGDANATLPGACLPEIQTNGVPPIAGNPFGLRMVGASPGSASIFLLDVGGPSAPIALPCPCGGIPTPFGTFWVNPFSPSTLVLTGIPSFSGGPCGGASNQPLPVPAMPSLLGTILFAQWAAVAAVGPTLGIELTEGARIVIG